MTEQNILLDRITEHSTYEERRTEEVLRELADRRAEALNIYEPQPFQAPFHACKIREVALIAGNQTGKSLAGFVEVARCVTNRDPFNKYPDRGLVVCLGYDEKHITRMHDYLLRAGEFQMIWDHEKKGYRTYNPKFDSARASEARPAPPLIPRRYIKQISWISKKDRIFAKITLHNGWEIWGFSSRGEPAQGFKADLVHIDEDIQIQSWYSEMLARLSMQEKGRLIWTAMPQSKNDAMVNLVNRARQEEEDEDPRPSAKVFKATIFDNIYLPESVIEQNVKAWKAEGEEVYLRRAKGEMILDHRQMYPTFARIVHCLPKTGPQKVLKVMAERGNQPPEDWCKYTITDPGHSRCAVAFIAVPPPEIYGRYVIQYDELYLAQCDAAMYGKAMGRKVARTGIQAHIIDEHGSRPTEAGSGKTIKRQYSDALRANNVKSYHTKFGYLAGSDDVKARCNAVRELLTIRGDIGQPTYLVVAANCPNTLREFDRYNKKTQNVGGTQIILDTPMPRHNHLMNCLEYAAAHGVPYVKAPPAKKAKTTYELWRERKDFEKKMRNYDPMSALNTNHITLGPRGA